MPIISEAALGAKKCRYAREAESEYSATMAVLEEGSADANVLAAARDSTVVARLRNETLAPRLSQTPEVTALKEGISTLLEGLRSENQYLDANVMDLEKTSKEIVTEIASSSAGFTGLGSSIGTAVLESAPAHLSPQMTFLEDLLDKEKAISDQLREELANARKTIDEQRKSSQELKGKNMQSRRESQVRGEIQDLLTERAKELQEQTGHLEKDNHILEAQNKDLLALLSQAKLDLDAERQSVAALTSQRGEALRQQGATTDGLQVHYPPHRTTTNVPRRCASVLWPRVAVS